MNSGDPTLEFAAGLLDYHDRERKPVWWAFFDRIELSDDELVEDPESIGLLEPTGPSKPDKQSLRHRFTYPAQEHKLGLGQRPFDPATGKGAGEIVEFDRETRVVALKRGPILASTPVPTALLPGEPYKTKAQEDAIKRIARSLVARDLRYPAVESVLRRDPFTRDVQTADVIEMANLVLSLDGRHLVIQGPPGTGKTWTSGRLIARLIAEGNRVGVASTSHKAIHKRDAPHRCADRQASGPRPSMRSLKPGSTGASVLAILVAHRGSRGWAILGSKEKIGVI